MEKGQSGGKGCYPPCQMGDNSKGQELPFLGSLVLQESQNMRK